MESARRVDEWKSIRDRVPPLQSVLVPLADRQQELQSLDLEFPDRDVIAAIDGLTPIDELSKRLPVTQMDLETIIADFIDEGFLRPLSEREMLDRATWLEQQQDIVRASQMYRAMVGLNPACSEAVERLGQLLGHLGAGPEAAQCYAELAAAFLSDGRTDEALQAATVANDFYYTPHSALLLVRCLISVGDDAQAVHVLMDLARHLLEQDQYDDVRSTCLKILQIDPDQKEAKRLLSRVHHLAGGQAGGEDVVVCVACGEINDRDQEECKACHASLHMTCLSCGRVVGVSDNICVFCGANPHHDRDGAMGLSEISDDVILQGRRLTVEEDDGAWESRVRQTSAMAREYEEDERYSDALKLWKEIGQNLLASDVLQDHIRCLEALVHDREIEFMIERGHMYRSGRRFLRAVKSYTQAKRILSSDDPRALRLEELITSTRRLNQQVSLIYAVAILLIIGFAVVIYLPMYQAKEYRRQVDTLMAEFSSMNMVQLAGAKGKLYTRAQ